ncbi:unnamed protein product [Symbiodinium sp. CCMP2592]|nr:unnamed protein product [Symbiodinium sp. CCMP2592]
MAQMGSAGTPRRQEVPRERRVQPGHSRGDYLVLAKALQKFFDNAKDGYNNDADQTTRDDDQQDLKVFFRPWRDVAGKAKVDVVQEIFRFRRSTTTPQLRLSAGRCRPTWTRSPPRPMVSLSAAGTTKKLYKSEAIDSFDDRYLPCVYETVKEADKAVAE